MTSRTAPVVRPAPVAGPWLLRLGLVLAVLAPIVGCQLIIPPDAAAVPAATVASATTAGHHTDHTLSCERSEIPAAVVVQPTRTPADERETPAAVTPLDAEPGAVEPERPSRGSAPPPRTQDSGRHLLLALGIVRR